MAAQPSLHEYYDGPGAEQRIARNGWPYTRRDFIEFYGEDWNARWEEASIATARRGWPWEQPAAAAGPGGPCTPAQLSPQAQPAPTIPGATADPWQNTRELRAPPHRSLECLVVKDGVAILPWGGRIAEARDAAAAVFQEKLLVAEQAVGAARAEEWVRDNVWGALPRQALPLSDWDVDWLVVRLIAEEDRSREELGYPSSAPVLAPAARAESGHAPSPRELPRSAPSSEVRAEEEEVRRKRWRPSIQLAQAAEEEVRAEKRKKQKVLRLARDGLSVEVGSESSGRMEDVEFRLQKDGWLLISRFFEEQLGPQALGLVKSMTQ